MMVFLPPRHSKSMTISESFPAYFIGKSPERRVIQVSYGDNLARKFGRANRSKLDEFGGSVFDIYISQENASAANWGIEGHRGGMISAGIGGPITGEGADLLVVDDPIKNRREADSPTYREMVWDEWQNTLLTRLQPDGAIILIMTRWHEDDLAGRLLNPDYGPVEDWDVISLPAIAEENDILGRKEGAPLWPEYGYDEEWAAEKKIAIGSYAWNSLYQQRPSPPEGSIVQRQWWKYYSTPINLEEMDEIIQSWDLSFKDLQTSDYVVGQVWGRKGADKYLIDQIRGKIDFTQTIKALRSLTEKYPTARAKLIEDKANGPAIISITRQEIPGIIAINPRGSKESRAYAASPDIEAGNVYLPSPAIAPWITDYIEEWASFPNGLHDDQVDATTQALDRLSRRGKGRESYSGRGARLA